MDSVRFGRALGIGARGAAKALAGAVDAATAPNPTPVKARPTSTGGPDVNTAAAPTPAARPVAKAAQAAARATMQARQTTEGVARGGKRFGEAMWGPLVKVSGVLWLEITGAFFGLFALFAGQAAWTHRADLGLGAVDRDARVRALVFLGMTVGFGYFCLSSFVRARRKGRG